MTFENPTIKKIALSREWKAACHKKTAFCYWNIPIKKDKHNQLNKRMHKRREIEQFLEEHFTESYLTSRSVIYPCGGPDFLYPDLFFPNMDHLILIGLEPIGKFPDLMDLRRHPSYLATLMSLIGAHIQDLPFRTYYVTQTLHQFQVDTAILLAANIALTGYEIIDYESGRTNLPIIHFRYRKDPHDHERHLYYVQSPISDLHQHPDFKELIEHIMPETAFYKASSFVTQEASSAAFQDFLLNQVRFVIQGISGIPFSSFSTGLWTTKLFGIYSKSYKSGPQNLFPDWGYQENLDAAYTSLRTGTNTCSDLSWEGLIPFYFDYGGQLTEKPVCPNGSSLQFSIKKTTF